MNRFIKLIKMLYKGIILDFKVGSLRTKFGNEQDDYRDFLTEKYTLVYSHRSKMVNMGFRSFYEEFNEFFRLKKEYMETRQWSRLRKRTMEKHNHKCYCCGSKATEVHHETYYRLFNEILDDLKPLCRECHEKQHMLTGLEWSDNHRVEKQ